MKPRKLSKTLLAAVLMLSLLVSVFPGFGIASVADATTWDHSYEVIQNTGSTDGYIDQINMKNDFQVYKWTHTATDNVYKDDSLTAVEGYPKAMGADDLRNTPNSVTVTQTGGTATATSNDNGNLNFAPADLTTYALTNVNENAKVDTDFVMEVTMRGTSRVGYRSIVISPEKGKFNLNASGNKGATGLAINVTDDQYFTRFVIAGAIDPNSLSVNKMKQHYDADSQSWSIGLSADYAVGCRPTDSVNNANYSGPKSGKDATYRIEVKDGMVTIYNVTDPDLFLAAKLTDDFAGGYVSFAGNNHNFNGTLDDGSALVSMKWSDVDSANEYNYAFERNTTNTSTYDVNFLKDFSVYRWEFPVSSGVVTGAPTLRTAVAGRGINTIGGSTDGGYDPKGSASLVYLASNRGDESKSAGFDGGYYSFVRYQADGGASSVTSKSNLQWQTSASYTSNFLASFTHRRTLAADEDFYLEMSMLADASGDANTQAIMIAPKGDFAVTQDAVADNGVFIAVNASNNWTTVAGAIENSFNDDDVTLVVNGANNTNTGSGNWHRVTRTADVALASQVALGGAIPTDLTFYGDASNTLTAHQGGVVTFCVLVKDGVLSVWNKADSTVMMKLTLTDAYEGGAVSYVGSNFNRGAFAGMYLTTDETKFPAEAAGTYAYDTTSQDQIGDADADAAFQTYLNANYDLYVDGVKAEGVSGNDTGWTADYISGSLMGNYLELKPLTNDDKASTGALVPKTTSKGGNVVSLFGSDIEVETALRLMRTDSGDAAGNLPMIGLRMAKIGDMTSDGVYVKYVRDASNGKVVLVEVKGGVPTETELASTALHNTAVAYPKLYVKLAGTALTGYVQYNDKKIDFSATVSYDEAGFAAFGATAGRVMTDLLKVNLIETADFAAAANVGNGTLTVERADTDKAGQYKFIITATPNAGAALKAGSLIATVGGKQIVPARIGFQTDDSQDLEYVVYATDDVTVGATFYAPTAVDPNFAKLGTSINKVTDEAAAGNVGGGLRFLFHADIHKNVQDNKFYMTIDSTEKEVVDFGALLATESTVTGLGHALTLDDIDAPYVGELSVLESGLYYDYADSYVQYGIQVTNILVYAQEDTKIVARGYVTLKNADGSTTTVYADVPALSYNDHIAAGA